MIVQFTRNAQADLDQLRSFISQEHPTAASRLVSRLLELSWALADNPKEGRKTNEPGVHVLIVARLNYLIFYRLGFGERVVLPQR
jgi:toxin ParE1/3/4